MPSVGPQGSRGGLITAVVIFTIGFVTATIFAIYFGVALNKEQDLRKTDLTRSKKIYLDATSPRIVALESEAASNPNLREKTAMAAAIDETQQLSEAISGHNSAATTQPTISLVQANQALAQAAAKTGINNLPTDLSGAVTALANYAAGQAQQVQDLRQAQTKGAADAASKIAETSEVAQHAEQDLNKENDLRKQMLDQQEKDHADYNAKLAEYSRNIDNERQQYNDSLKKLEASVADKDKRIDSLKKQYETLENRLAGRRLSVIEPIVRRSQGTINSVASEDVVYIDLGQGEHILPGMTFEVYNRHDGVPKLGDGMSSEDMPAGEGAIEVEQVGAYSSQCRIIKTEVGQHINQGDLIANLVYDRNTRFDFVVYGKFDLGQTGQPKDADREKIEALIIKWGGKIQPKIDPDTDFVVMGAEPKVEQFSADDLQDPFNVSTKQKEEAELKSYDDVLNQAKELHIPIMNQNRFLYFCGYYENSQE
jgi:predicted  nucleic acid-binding Zn-ribbon protein